MSRSIDVTIKNNSGMNQAYVFFADAPEVQRARNISQCALTVTRPTPEGASSVIELPTLFYAIQCFRQGEQVQIASSRPVSLADSNGNGGSVVSFDGQDGNDPSAPPGCFKIICGDRGIPGQSMGLGVGSDRNIMPIAVWDADNNTTYTVHPSNNYYVAMGGQYRQGQAIDASQLGNGAVKIDSTQRRVTVNNGPDGRLTISKW